MYVTCINRWSWCVCSNLGKYWWSICICFLSFQFIYLFFWYEWYNFRIKDNKKCLKFTILKTIYMSIINVPKCMAFKSKYYSNKYTYLLKVYAKIFTFKNNHRTYFICIKYYGRQFITRCQTKLRWNQNSNWCVVTSVKNVILFSIVFVFKICLW